VFLIKCCPKHTTMKSLILCLGISLKLGTFSQSLECVTQNIYIFIFVTFIFSSTTTGHNFIAQRPSIWLSLAIHTVNEIKNEFGEMRLQVSIMSRVIRQGKRFISFTKHKKVYSFCLMVEALDHGYVLHTRRIHFTRYRIRYDMISDVRRKV
jgi:hypothetical protein